FRLAPVLTGTVLTGTVLTGTVLTGTVLTGAADSVARHCDHRPPLRVEREYLQLNGQVDLTHIDPGRHVQHERGEVQDAGHPRRDQPVADVLGGRGGRGDDPD